MHPHIQTSLIILTEDIKEEKRVALKLMANEEQWQREKDMRRSETGSNLDEHVLKIIETCIDQNAKGCKDQRPFLIAMPAAEMDLADFLSHTRVADYDPKVSVDIIRQVGQHVQYIHKCGWIHGDLKPRNCVKIEDKWCGTYTHTYTQARAHMHTCAHMHTHAQDSD